MAMTKSAFAASRLAAVVPVAPIALCQLRMVRVQSTLTRLRLRYRDASTAGEAG